MQRKRKSRKSGSHSTLSLLKRELREGNLQSLFGGSSCIVSSSNAAPDPLLSSFIMPMDYESVPPHSSADSTIAKKSTTGSISERLVDFSCNSVSSDSMDLSWDSIWCKSSPITVLQYVDAQEDSNQHSRYMCICGTRDSETVTENLHQNLIAYRKKLSLQTGTLGRLWLILKDDSDDISEVLIMIVYLVLHLWVS